MTRRHLMIFTEVYRFLSMSRAAETLFISQPAVSQAIRELEAHYGTALFYRDPRSLRPTAAGEALYQKASRILRLFDEADADVAAGDAPVIRMGAILSAGVALLAGYIHEFERLYPLGRVYARVTGSKKLIGLLLAGDIEFALLEDTVLPKGLSCIPFYSDRLAIVARGDDPMAGRTVTFDELSKRDFLLRESGAGVRDAFDYLIAKRGARIEPLWESSSSTVLMEGVKAGFGISVQPYLMAKRLLDAGELCEIRVSDLPLDRGINVVSRKSASLSRAAADFVDIVLRDAEK